MSNKGFEYPTVRGYETKDDNNMLYNKIPLTNIQKRSGFVLKRPGAAQSAGFKIKCTNNAIHKGNFNRLG